MRIGLGQTDTQTLVPPLNSTDQLNAAVAPLVGSTLTPENVAQPLPDITTALAPGPVACSQWAQLNGMITDNPIVAVVALSALFVFLYPKKKRPKR